MKTNRTLLIICNKYICPDSDKHMNNRDSNKVWAYGRANHQSILQGYENVIELPTEVLGELYAFYVLHSPVDHMSNQRRTFAEYGWTGNITTNALGKTLDDVRETSGGKFLLPKRPPAELQTVASHGSYMRQLFHYASLDDDTLANLSIERAVSRATPDDNAWLRLFRRIRNCLAHGRFVVVSMDDGHGPVIVMEDKDRYNYTARMVFRLRTLLHWKRVVESGPQVQDESTPS